MMRTALALVLGLALAAPAAAQNQDQNSTDDLKLDQDVEIFPREEDMPGVTIAPPVPRATLGTGAVLRGLDKITGEVEDITLPNGGQVSIGRLEISLRECRHPAGNPSGDAWANLAIREAGRSETLFNGWMIASSPALNALDHARYDVWVLRCSTS